jgi:hypothetical protein
MGFRRMFEDESNEGDEHFSLAPSLESIRYARNLNNKSGGITKEIVDVAVSFRVSFGNVYQPESS